MTKPLRIYVAGPYNGSNVIEVLNNIARGTRVCMEVFKKGHIPFCPWLDFHFQFFGELTLQQYHAYSIAWLEVSEALLLIGGESTHQGVRQELSRAIELGLPVYRSLEEVPVAKP